MSILSGGRAVGLGMAVVGLVAIVLASGFREGTAHGGPGTRFLPVLLGRDRGRRWEPSSPSGRPLPRAPAEPLAPGGARRVAWTLGAVLGYVLAFERLGFLLATVPFLAMLLLVYGERRWPVVLAVALGATGATYALFACGSACRCLRARSAGDGARGPP